MIISISSNKKELAEWLASEFVENGSQVICISAGDSSDSFAMAVADAAIAVQTAVNGVVLLGLSSEHEASALDSYGAFTIWISDDGASPSGMLGDMDFDLECYVCTKQKSEILSVVLEMMDDIFGPYWAEDIGFGPGGF